MAGSASHASTEGRGRRRLPRFTGAGGSVLLVLVGLLAGLLVSELFLASTGIDERVFLGKLHILNRMLAVHQPVKDPDLLYRLRPGSTYEGDEQYGPFLVRINSLGFRGAERTVDKAPKEYRILCLGGSNVFGAALGEDETWPAQLEALLRQRGYGAVSVWNLGVNAYTALQMATLGREAVDRFDPDLVIFGLSNAFPRHIPINAEDILGYFNRDPSLWVEHFPWLASVFDPRLRWSARAWLLNHVHIYRLALLALSKGGPDPMPPALQVPRQVSVPRAFLQSLQGRIATVVFYFPAAQREIFSPITQGLQLPTMDLAEAARRETRFTRQELDDIHPSPEVCGWYAKTIADWLEDRGLLARCVERTFRAGLSPPG